MNTCILIYLIFGICITCSSRTNIMWKEKWYMQLLYVIGYPIVIFITVIKTARLALTLFEMMDDEKNRQIANPWISSEHISYPSTGRHTLYGDKKEVECGQDMLESHEFTDLLYEYITAKEYSNNPSMVELRLEAIKKYIRQYFSPFK